MRITRGTDNGIIHAYRDKAWEQRPRWNTASAWDGAGAGEGAGGAGAGCCMFVVSFLVIAILSLLSLRHRFRMPMPCTLVVLPSF